MSPRSFRPAPRGVVLILLSGMIALLMALAMTLVSMARELNSQARGRSSRAAASLCAASGMDYAAARLTRDPFPLWRTGCVQRGDDWSFREIEELPLSGGSGNPSYSHGEHWIDKERLDGLDNDADGSVDEEDEGDGACQPWDQGGADLDGDGRFSAWTGRLRGDEPCRSLFSLRVSAAPSRIPVNAGTLDLPENESLGGAPVVSFANSGLEAVLNNLGAVLRPMAEAPAGGWTRRHDVAAGGGLAGEPIRVSWLGFDLIRNRPVGGYPTEAKVRETLEDEGYSAREIDLFLRHLEIGPYRAVSRRQPSDWNDEVRRRWVPAAGDPDPRILSFADPGVGLHSASAEALQAMWLYMSGAVWGIPGSLAPWLTRAGPMRLRYSQTDASGIAQVVRIFPDEAEALARLTLRYRKEGRYDWRSFRERVSEKAPLLFQRDYADLAAEPARSAWVRAKAAFAAVALSGDPTPWNPIPATFATGGVDARPDLPGVQPFSPLASQFVAHVTYPPLYAASYALQDLDAPYRWEKPGGWWPIDPFSGGASAPPRRIPVIFPLRFHLEPPSAFLVGSAAHGAARSGTFRLPEAMRLDLSTQDDFDAADYGLLGLDQDGIEVLDPFPGEQCAWMADGIGGRCYPRTTSYPHLRSTIVERPLSRHWGGIGLAGLEAGSQGAPLYHAFPEDFDGVSANDNRGEPAGSPFATQLQTELPNISGRRSGAPWWATLKRVNMLFQLFDCPALEQLDRMDPLVPVPGFTMEAWIAPPALKGSSSGDILTHLMVHFESGSSVGRGVGSIGILSRRRVDSSGAYLELNVRMQWPELEPPVWSAIPISDRKFVVREFDPATGGKIQTGFYHVALTIEQVSTPDLASRCRLYVNGEVPPNGQWDYPGTQPAQVAQALDGKVAAENADEIRFYDRTLTAQEIRDRREGGRFVAPALDAAPDPAKLLARLPSAPPNPVYRSPRYAFPSAYRPAQCAWSGLSSAAFDPLVRMRVVVFGYDQAGSIVSHAILPQSGEPAVLEELRDAASFRYAVEFYRPGGGAAPPGPLFDTPVLESLWFTLQRRDRAPEWRAWSER